MQRGKLILVSAQDVLCRVPVTQRFMRRDVIPLLQQGMSREVTLRTRMDYITKLGELVHS